VNILDRREEKVLENKLDFEIFMKNVQTMQRFVEVLHKPHKKRFE